MDCRGWGRGGDNGLRPDHWHRADHRRLRRTRRQRPDLPGGRQAHWRVSGPGCSQWWQRDGGTLGGGLSEPGTSGVVAASASEQKMTGETPLGPPGRLARVRALQAFQYREFRLLWASQFTTAMGQWMDQ